MTDFELLDACLVACPKDMQEEAKTFSNWKKQLAKGTFKQLGKLRADHCHAFLDIHAPKKRRTPSKVTTVDAAVEALLARGAYDRRLESTVVQCGRLPLDPPTRAVVRYK